jgi:hypothetical protein
MATSSISEDPMSSPPNKLSYAIAALALSAFLTGCSSYLDNGDTVSRSAGDAVDANVAIHTIDPWPLAASETEILSDGSAIKATTSGSSSSVGGDTSNAAAAAAAATTPATAPATTPAPTGAGSGPGGTY